MSRSAIWIVAVFVAVLALLTCGSYYNTPATLDQNVQEAWGNVQSAYQRRYDLVPNLVETVKASSAFEERVFTEVAEARASVGRTQLSAEDLDDPAKVKEFQAAQAELGSSLSRLLAVVESYPDLKSTAAFRDLMVQLEGTESRISTERIRYNKAVKEYNVCVVTVPCSIFASMRGFREMQPFAADEGAQASPKVDFGTPANP